MTAQEMRTWLEKRPFEPFRITLNNGESYDVRHPELALIAETGALYVFQPATAKKAAHVSGLQSSCAIRNICSIDPLPMSTSTGDDDGNQK